MNKRTLLLFVLSSTLVGVLFWGGGFFDEPEDEWYRDIRRGHWIWWGAEADVLDATLQEIASSSGARRDSRYDAVIEWGPGNWTYEFTQLGNDRLEQAGRIDDPERARQLFHLASVYFGLAKYPGHGFDPYEIRAHQAQLAAYESSQKLHPSIDFSVLELSVQGGTIRGYLYLPKDRPAAVPLVLGTNGITGGGIPVATGAALAHKRLGRPGIVSTGLTRCWRRSKHRWGSRGGTIYALGGPMRSG